MTEVSRAARRTALSHLSRAFQKAVSAQRRAERATTDESIDAAKSAWLIALRAIAREPAGNVAEITAKLGLAVKELGTDLFLEDEVTAAVFGLVQSAMIDLVVLGQRRPNIGMGHGRLD